jgi:hypothetical protein
LRSRCVSSASKFLDTSDQGGETAPPGRLDQPGGQTAPPGRLDRTGWPHLLVKSSPSVLWLNRVTQWFLVNHCKPRELGVASANRHS